MVITNLQSDFYQQLRCRGDLIRSSASSYIDSVLPPDAPSDPPEAIEVL